MSPDASNAQAEQVLQELSNDMMSPYCPGRTIAACPSKAARKLEDDILAQAKQGKSRDEIETALVERFGSDIVGYAPRPIVLYTTVLTAITALLVLFYVGRRWVRKKGGPVVDRGVADGPVSASVASVGSAPTREELDALDDALDEEDQF